MRRARAPDRKDPVAAANRFVSSKAAEEFPQRRAGSHNNSCVSLWYRDLWAKVQFRISIGPMEILQNPPGAFDGRGVSGFSWPDRSFFDLSHRKSGSDRDSAYGILSFQYVACDPDNVVDARPNNGYTNYCLAWALSES